MYKNTSFVPGTQVVTECCGTYLNYIKIWILNFLPKLMKQYLKCSPFNIGLFAEPENTDSQYRDVKGRNLTNLLQFFYFGNKEKFD